jgi:hypothetical protein
MLSSLLIVLTLSAVAAEPAPAGESSQEAARRKEVALLAPAKARQMEVWVGEEAAEKATLHAEPLLRWSNPTAGSVYGEVFLWSRHGRPVAIASIYRWYHPLKDSTLEVVSVSPAPLRAKEGTALLWESKSAGLTFRPLPGAPDPAETAGARLGQMRAASRRFTAELVDKRGGDEVPRQLRLLNQPVHRYSSSEEQVVDGALFALVETTDPEVWLLLEAAKHKDSGRVIWQYAVARMNADAIKVRLDDKEVQSFSKIVEPWRYRQATYTLVGFKPESVKLEQPAERP